MNILIYTCDYKPMLGGVAEYLYNVAKEMSKRHHVVVLAPDMKGATSFDKKQPFSTYRYWNNTVHDTLLSGFNLLKVVKEEQIDRIFVGMYYPSGFVTYLTSALHKKPYVIGTHAVEILEAKGKRNHYDGCAYASLRRAVEYSPQADTQQKNSRFSAFQRKRYISCTTVLTKDVSQKNSGEKKTNRSYYSLLPGSSITKDKIW